EAADGHGDERQSHVPEIVEDPHRPGEVAPIVGGEAPQREPLDITAAGEEDDQQYGEQEGRNGAAGYDGGRSPGIEAAAVAQGLGDAERDRDQIDDQRRPDADRDRDRHLLQDEADHRGVAEEALAEIEGGVAAQHDPEALADRLVEAVILLDSLDESGI